ncbi:MAG: OmpH family outer membrane protein [Clostridiaceae bacterium]|jgi:Skp family chaperone for outer membrane proteins|nr:OmpH family outer membrane protein [Clostridiaceae bacterium]
MRKLGLGMVAVTLGVMMFSTASANAASVGYIDYTKVQENYPAAQAAIKEIDAQSLSLQQYMVDKEKQYKALDTPLKKQNFEDMTSREFQAKQDTLEKLKAQKDEQIYSKIQAAAKQVLVEQKLDAIVDYRVIFVGGVDISDLVIQKLRAAGN